EAWMKAGLTFKADNQQDEIAKLKQEIAQLKDQLAANDASAGLRTQNILLQAENGELKRQLEQVTDPAYLTGALKALGLTDRDDQAEDIETLVDALRVAKQGINDWMHIYAHDMCDEDRVEEARKRVHYAGPLAYIADINVVINEALALFSDQAAEPVQPT